MLSLCDTLLLSVELLCLGLQFLLIQVICQGFWITSDDDMVALFRAGSCLLVLLLGFEFQIYLHQMWVQYFVGYSGTPL